VQVQPSFDAVEHSQASIAVAHKPPLHSLAVVASTVGSTPTCAQQAGYNNDKEDTACPPMVATPPCRAEAYLKGKVGHDSPNSVHMEHLHVCWLQAVARIHTVSAQHGKKVGRCSETAT
jgi:hypothetical protein